MTELLTAAQMHAIEQAAIAAGQVTGLELMERAGQGVVDAVLDEWPDYRNTPASVSVFCGPGNNGGDGFVIARLLHDLGWRVAVWFHGDAGKLPPDARVNHDRWAALGEVRVLDQTAFRKAPSTELYVDAVFGTGLSRPVNGELGDFLRYLAGSGGDYGYYQPRMVAVDVPSGLCADSGKALGCPNPSPGTSIAPFARLTVTFETPKPGHFLANGPMLCGKLVVKDIGLSEARAQQIDFEIGRFEGRGLRIARLSLYPSRRDAPGYPFGLWEPQLYPKTVGHKYSHGHALVLTGGQGKSGAARLAARGALRIGAGLVTLGVPQDAVPEVAAQITGLMMTPVETADDLRKVLTDDRINVVCLGPGLGLERARELVPVVLQSRASTRPSPRVVLDADALSAFGDQAETVFGMLHKDCVLTPHLGEFERLFPEIAKRLKGPVRPSLVGYQDIAAHEDAFQIAQKSMAEIDAYRAALAAQTGPAFSKVDAVREAAERAGCVILLKGPDTVVANPTGTVWVHSAAYDRASPWLATAGAGDVLAGFIAGLLARGRPPEMAAILAARLHVDCARAFGPGLIAEDLPEMLPQVLRALGD